MCLPGWRTPRTPATSGRRPPPRTGRCGAEPRGPMASNGAEAGGFVRSRDSLPGARPAVRPAARVRRRPGRSRRPTGAASAMLVGPSHAESRGRRHAALGGSRGARRWSTPPTSPTRPTWTSWSPGSAGPGDRRVRPLAGLIDRRACRARTSTTRSSSATGSGHGRIDVPPDRDLRDGRHAPRPCATPSCACAEWTGCASSTLR